MFVPRLLGCGDVGKRRNAGALNRLHLVGERFPRGGKHKVGGAHVARLRFFREQHYFGRKPPVTFGSLLGRQHVEDVGQYAIFRQFGSPGKIRERWFAAMVPGSRKARSGGGQTSARALPIRRNSHAWVLLKSRPARPERQGEPIRGATGS